MWGSYLIYGDAHGQSALSLDRSVSRIQANPPWDIFDLGGMPNSQGPLNGRDKEKKRQKKKAEY